MAVCRDYVKHRAIRTEAERSVQVESSHYPDRQAMAQSPLGEALLPQEARVVEEALDGIFGEQCLQLGMWGDDRTFMRFTRTQRMRIRSRSQRRPASRRLSASCIACRSPATPSTVVLLPHTLDFSDRPHAILREVDRVLRSTATS